QEQRIPGVARSALAVRTAEWRDETAGLGAQVFRADAAGRAPDTRQRLRKRRVPEERLGGDLESLSLGGRGQLEGREGVAAGVDEAVGPISRPDANGLR